MRQEAIENYGIVEGDDQDEWNRLGPMVEPTRATARNMGAAERKTRRRVEASTTSPWNQRQTEPAAQTQRTEQMEETQGDEDLDELIEAVAEALSQVERDEQVSHAAREATGDMREDARMMRERSGYVGGDAENILHQSDQWRCNTPWGLWSAARKEIKDLHVTQGSISAMMDDNRRHKLDTQMKELEHSEFQRKAWMQIDMASSAWVTACPKEHSALNARQFPVMAQTYFGVPQQCLEGVVGQAMLQKSCKRGRHLRETLCDPYGENRVKATLPGGGWTYHDNGINLQLHRIFRQSCMTNDMEVEDCILRKVREMAINLAETLPLLSKNLRGYVPDGHQTGIANRKYPAEVNQFTEIKVIHSGTVQYSRTGVRDNPQGSAAVDNLHGKVRGTYIVNLK
jgi:hypothetical protein